MTVPIEDQLNPGVNESGIADIKTPIADQKSDSEDDSTNRPIFATQDNAQRAVRRAVRKLDMSILPLVTMFYFLSFLVIHLRITP